MIRPGFLCCLALSLLAGGSAWSNDPPRDRIDLGQPVPAFSVKTADGFVRRYQEFEGASGLVVLFATHDTATEVQTLEPHLLKLAEDGINTLIVDIDCFASPRSSEMFWTDGVTELPVRYDNGDVAGLFEVNGVPYAALIDGNGVLQYLGATGMTENDRRRLIDFFEKKLLGGQGEAPELSTGSADLSFLPHCRGVER